MSNEKDWKPDPQKARASQSKENPDMEERYYWQRIDLTKDEGSGDFIAPDGVHYDDPQELMYHWGLGLCGCGRPHDVHQILIDCLKCFDEGDGINDIAKIVTERPKAAAEFIAHFLDQRSLTEHGGSVYGSWLTDLGEQFIEIGPMEDGL